MIDWITPRGESLVPTIARNSKCDRGFAHDRTGELLCPADLDWSKDEYVFRSAGIKHTVIEIWLVESKRCFEADTTLWPVTNGPSFCIETRSMTRNTLGEGYSGIDFWFWSVTVISVYYYIDFCF